MWIFGDYQHRKGKAKTENGGHVAPNLSLFTNCLIEKLKITRCPLSPHYLYERWSVLDREKDLQQDSSRSKGKR